jgi:site-specific DNA recombinase
MVARPNIAVDTRRTGQTVDRQQADGTAAAKERALGVIRLSRMTEETTSPARQRQIIEQWAHARGATIVGWAEDEGVSAAVDPWDRPQLGPWLRGEQQPFDTLVVWRLDRLARRVLHFAALLEWARAEDKDMVSATEGFDLSTPLGRMFAQMIAMLAEGELEAIKERQKSSYQHLVTKGRHRGGFLPYGYRAVKNADGGYRLEIDDGAATIIREIVRRVLDGRSINSIVTWLNDNNVHTSLDHQRARAGKEPQGCAWRVGNLSKLMRSRTLLGYVTPEDGTAVVDEHGMEVRRAEPILSLHEWKQVGERLAARRTKNPGPYHRANGAMLLRVAYCGVCGQPLYRVYGRHHPYYRCASKSVGGRACGNTSVRATVLEQVVGDLFLARVGDLDVTRKILVPGEDHTDEIERARQALRNLTRRLEQIPQDSERAATILARMDEHEQTIATLKARPHRPDRWAYEPTGETFRQLWTRLDDQERGRLLRDCRVRITWTPVATQIDLGDLDELALRAQDHAATIVIRPDNAN